jgi:hypothetical protein
MSTIRPTPAPAGARDALGLATELFALGLREGVPAHLAARAESIDRQLCRALRCPACRRRGLGYRPFTDGRRYVVLAACPACGAGEEV